ncbi:MAG: NYN domain-containing protein [Magnetococcales bacterium]|nr:NYN domain-containing protein [Magnetococcales bacterium]NGZ27117.1 NYN domain-containing protein [Magnetococcales bacterium]NGZ28740.1 NYN domain-containing protein [Magnetococcales bacterium]
MFYQTEKVAVFIDGSNLYAAIRSLGFDFDYKKLLDYFQARCNLLRAYYYTALGDEQDYSPIRPLVDWLAYNGYTVITKPIKEYVDPVTGNRRTKGNMDIEISVGMLSMTPYYDHAVLFSGDGDFRSVVEAVQQRGKRVTVISSLLTQPPMIADELRRQADDFIELNSLRDSLVRHMSS